ncbi:BolA-like protein [Glaciecola punicea ACAM 611]|jgi:acid stress-induced BolA-like protein IbaG/YrbA|uniref:BolA-like protein n=1 Tax=Glaciecola punicea ACAM 611 TaxID=1121923 RepID=H5T8H7_9ALTE|nr:BolA family protein [Glaciecola punicea]OFA30507.1 cell division protein BolA [Glaciecola punicea]GAB54618.1 BolA-like protein [Glaciecola punicea ACAM 611]
MTNEEIAQMLTSVLSLQEVKVKSEGTHFQIIAIDDRFEDMSRVKRQQFVYAPLSELISQGTIHAVSIKTFGTAQWQREKLFN